MKPVSEIVSFLEHFTIKKFFVLIIILAVAVICFLAFEGYTSHFFYSRAERQAELLDKLATIREKHSLTTDESKIREELLAQLSDRSRSPTLPGSSSYNFPTDKFIYGMIPWAIVLLSILFSKKETKKGSAVLGIGVFMVIFGLIATLSPFDALVMKLLVIPVGLVVGFAALFAGIGYAASNRTKNKNQVETEDNPITERID